MTLMEKSLFYSQLTLLLLQCIVTSSAIKTQANITTDQFALLSLKSQIISDPIQLLTKSWSQNTSVCDWIGVTCGSRHRRVTSLNISSMSLTGTIPQYLGNLTFLVSLDLRRNNFYGKLPQEMASLRRLKFMRLSYNNFSGEVPSWFGFLTQLQVLTLTNNSFTGLLPSSLSNISNLATLDLSFNALEGRIPEDIGNLENLRGLNLGNNNLKGSVPPSFSNATKLETLILSNNFLHGNIPDGIGDLHNLNWLTIETNQLTGHMPQSLSRCYELQLLSLSNNEFDGPLPSEIGMLSNLQALYLGFNHFIGEIPQEIGNLVNLLVVGMERNQLTGSIPKSIFNISALQLLSLQNNNLMGSLTREIGNLTMLQDLYLGENMLTGMQTIKVKYIFYSELPKEVSNLIELEDFSLGSNRFSGSFPMGIFNISGLRLISLTDNTLSGTLPSNIGSTLPNIELLYLGGLTSLAGTIPHSLSNCSKLTVLDLSVNKLSGSIPNSLGDLTLLETLNLMENNLSSDQSSQELSFLSSLTNCRNLKELSLSFNPLNGMLPASVGNLSTSLEKILASDCKIKGGIPNEIGNLSSLIFLLNGSIGDSLCKLQNLGNIELGENQFSGLVPECLGNITSLRGIKLNSNRLSSTIPSSLGNLKDLLELDLSSNNMSGSLPVEIGYLKVAIRIDLSWNQFSDGIPREIGDMQNLIHLSLAQNKLQVSIPDSIGNMLSLEFLDLSNNNLSGSIPTSLENLQHLNYFNVSFNSLRGEIPSSGPFKGLSGQSFMFNEALCGAPRFRVPPCLTSSNHDSKRKKLLLIVFPLLGAAVIIVFVTLAFVWMRYRREENAPVQADLLATRGRISYYEIVQATNDFSESNFIGSGSFGSVYKGILKDGTTIAVKVFNQQVEGAFKSFETECEVLRNLRHRNLTKVISSCSNLDFKALVLEYMPNGSLEKWLYSHNYFLDIMQRLCIMIDVACALEYLHHGCSAPVVHCDLKPSNVLLDENMVAHVSDFGISKLLGEDESDLHTKTLTTFGYIAPEYGREGLVSLKCDVFSYGIMLMETFTRRRPNDEIFDGDLSLKKWVSDSPPEAVVDPNLIRSEDKKSMDKIDCVASILKVALDCSAESPEERITMKDVVGMLQKIKIRLLSCSAST
ncbi:putative LRR receptor-like serine/threonine-protein kinase isoform X3 [Capsicum galapagoense]